MLRRNLLLSALGFVLTPLVKLTDRMRRVRPFVVDQASADRLVFSAKVRSMNLPVEFGLVSKHFRLSDIKFRRLDDLSFEVVYTFDPVPRIMIVEEA